ncbi:MAG: hypothetical protein MUE78_04445 [Ilumatobacteraceae bacterium]|jgi:hypothetical protein|nr:hypothetical protein [Ilumatobacteraceae bacterium]
MRTDHSRSRRHLLLLLAAASTAVAACGGDDGDDDAGAVSEAVADVSEVVESDDASEDAESAAAPSTAPSDAGSTDDGDEAATGDGGGAEPATSAGFADPCSLVDDAELTTLLGRPVEGSALQVSEVTDLGDLLTTEAECKWTVDLDGGYFVDLDLFIQGFEPAMAEAYDSAGMITAAQMAEGSLTYDDDVQTIEGLGASAVSGIEDSEVIRISDVSVVIGDDVRGVVSLELAGPGSSAVAAGVTPDVLTLRDELVDVARSVVDRL